MSSKRVTTFKIIGGQGRGSLKTRLKESASKKSAVLVVPLLATEFTDQGNRRVFRHILEGLSRVEYLDRVIFGLDKAKQEEVSLLHGLIKGHGVKKALVLWNDGPFFSNIFNEIAACGLGCGGRGKGKNLFMCFGLALALNARVVGVMDADIRNFNNTWLDRLFYPVLALDHDFSKAFYTRVTDKRLYGRVNRLLFLPLLRAFQDHFKGMKNQEAMDRADFFSRFLYPLSGENAYSASLLENMRFAVHWGAEVFTLAEVHEKSVSAAQVEFCRSLFDHKHREVLGEDPEQGLHGMARDIADTLFHVFSNIQEKGITDHIVREISFGYRKTAGRMIQEYAEQAGFSGLIYDGRQEEHLVENVFGEAVFRVSGRAIPLTASWKEISDKIPGIYEKIVVAAESGIPPN